MSTWVVEADGVNDYMTSETLGNLLSSKLKIASSNVTWFDTGYLWSQASQSSPAREFGLWRIGSDIELYLGGVRNVVSTNLIIDNSSVEVEVDFTAKIATFKVGGLVVFSGAVIIGNGRVNTDLRFFARDGGYYAPSGTRVGNTKIHLNDILVRDYDFNNSNHGAGVVTVNELVGGFDLIGVNMSQTGSSWVDLGGGVISSIPVIMNQLRNQGIQ